MTKIFQYECKRLLWNKFFFGLLAALLFYGWQTLSNVTIQGISRTAPFSPWSFGDYLSRMLPLIWIGALFFLTFFTSGKAKRTAVLTDAAPVPQRRYSLVRSAAALSGTGILILACTVEAAVFYSMYFGWRRWETLIFPVFLELIPPLVFALGSGWFLGQKQSWMVYVWMPVPLALRALPLPELFSLWTGSFFSEYPLALGAADPDFSVPAELVCVQMFLLISGLAFLAVRSRRQRK